MIDLQLWHICEYLEEPHDPMSICQLLLKTMLRIQVVENSLNHHKNFIEFLSIVKSIF